MFEVAGDLRRAPAEFENPVIMDAIKTLFTFRCCIVCRLIVYFLCCLLISVLGF